MSSNSDPNFKPRTVKCPECGRLTVYSTENPFRPFCSERCRLIDLGQWAEGSYRIPVEQQTPTGELDSEEEDPDDLQ